MNAAMPDLSLLSSQANSSEWLQKELEMRRLQQDFAGEKTKDEKLREATKGFESIFLQKLWQQMRATVPKEGYLHSKEEDHYVSMFDKELCDKLADAGGIGLGEMLYKQLKKSQNEASRVTAPSENREPAPVKPLSAKYDPRLLLPPEHREERGSQNPAASSDQEPALYTPLAGYEEDPAPTQGDAEDNNFGWDDDPAPQAQSPAPLGETPQVLAAPLGVEPEPVLPGDDPTLIQADARTLSAVEELARHLAPQASPVTKSQVTQLGGPQGVQDRPGEIRMGLPPEAEAAVTGGGEPTDPLHWPVEGRQTSSFGWRRNPLTGERAFHAGVDLAAAAGTPVKACWDGTVSSVGKLPGYGNMVAVQHEGGWESVYAHNSAFTVRAGDSVKAGQEIARVGNTGRSTGPHLHFELRNNGAPQDPVQVQNSLVAGRAPEEDA